MDVFQTVATSVHLAAKVISYIDQVREGPAEQAQLKAEICNVEFILNRIRLCTSSTAATDKSAWVGTLEYLLEPNGPATKLRQDLDMVAAKFLTSQAHGLRKKYEYLKWPFDKKEVQQCVERFQRELQAINTALASANLDLSHEMRVDLSDMHRQLAEQEYFEVLNWISKRDLGSTTQREPLEGTSDWLLRSPEFRGWEEGEGPMLWCYGRQGTGKSSLACAILKHLQTGCSPDTAALMVFCKFDDEQTSEDVTAALLRQILRQPKSRHQDLLLPSKLQALYRDQAKAEKQSVPKLETIRELLQEELARFQRTYIIIDGLDEIPDQEERSTCLDVIHELEPSPQLLVLSRELPEIREWFVSNPSATVEIVPRSDNIMQYVQDRLTKSKRLQKIISRPGSASGKDLASEIAAAVTAKASETYLLAELHMNALDAKTIQSRKDIRTTLDSLGGNYTSAYDMVFKRIEKICGGQNTTFERAMKFLMIISRAREPLAVDALEHAMAFEPAVIDDDFEDSLGSADEWTSQCAGLILIDESTGLRLVRLAHKTISEYLDQKLQEHFPSPESLMAGICLSYLQLPAFTQGAYSGDQADEQAHDRAMTYPFLSYASRYWGVHAYGQTNDRLLDQILCFCSQQGSVTTAAQIMRLYDTSWAEGWDTDHGVTGLHLCTYFGLEDAVARLIGEGAAVDAEDAQQTTPLMYAVMQKQWHVAKLLLQSGADASRVCLRGSTALHRACRNYHKDIWEAMVTLDRDINVNRQCSESYWYRQTPLQWAVQMNFIDGITLLLRREELDFDASYADSNIGCLTDAAYRDRHQLLDVLLTGGRIKQTPGFQKEINTAFTAAASVGNLRAAEVLLRHGADLNGRDVFGATPIIRVVDAGNLESIKWLFPMVNHHAKDEFNRGVLHSAAIVNREAIMRFFLENDETFDVNGQGQAGETPLHEVATNGDWPGIAKLLLDHGASFEIKDKHNRSPVDIARDYGRKGLLRLFGVGDEILLNPTVSDITPQSLMAAIEREPDDDLLMYLKHFEGRLEQACNWVDPEARIQPDTPLVITIIRRKLASAKYLLEQGANVHGLDRFWKTALHWAAQFGDTEIVQELLDRGACADALDMDDATPIDLAAHAEHLDLALQMLSHGASCEVDRVDRGWLPDMLGLACELGNIIAIQRLIEAGAPLNLKDADGHTPRQRAKLMGHQDAVALLDKAAAELANRKSPFLEE